MTTIDDVAEVALALPESTEVERYRKRSWAVCGKVFTWERPFSKADIQRFGTAVPPSGPIIAIATADLSEKGRASLPIRTRSSPFSISTDTQRFSFNSSS